MECVILKNAINQIDDFSNAASRKKTRWEKKNWSFNFFTIFFLQSIDHIGKKGPHNEKCSHVQKVTKWVHFWILSPTQSLVTKHQTFLLLAQMLLHVVHSWLHPFWKMAFADIAVAVAWRTFWLFGLYTHTLISEYGFQWRENHKQ